MLLLGNAMPIDGFSECLFLDKVISFTEDSLGSSRCFVVADWNEIWREIEKSIISEIFWMIAIDVWEHETNRFNCWETLLRIILKSL